MTESRLFLVACLVWMAGVATNYWITANLSIVGIVGGFLVLCLVFNREKATRLVIFFSIIFYLGLGYSELVGEGLLVQGKFLGSVIDWLTNFRCNLEDLGGRLISEPYAGFMNGILLGSKSGLGYELKQAFKTTGLTHIIAVSGYNVTIIITAFYTASQRVLPYKLRMGLVFGLILGFVILTGGSASVVRAGIMSALVLAARLFGRKAQALNSLIFAAGLMVIEQPSILVGDIGFQLSVAATVGLIVLNPILEKRVGERGVGKFLPASFREAFLSSLAAQIMTMPIILYYFKSLSIVSPIANLLILPVIPLAMTIGFLVIGAGLIYFPLGYILGFGAWVVLRAVVWVVDKLAAIPYASVVLPDWGRLLIIPYYGLLVYYFYAMRRRDEKN